ncbi:MAG: flagellar hook-length control protein FliK [Planctomycetota bacterium]
MSIVSFTTSKQGVQDLLAALPAPATPQLERSGSEDLSQEKKPGFNDLLRDSGESQQPPQRAESSEPADAQPRPESQQGEQSATDQAEPTDQDTQASDSAEDSTQDPSESESSEQGTDQSAEASGDNPATDTSEEAQVQAAANAVSAQLNVVDALAADQAKAQAQAATTPQTDTGQIKQVTSSEKPSAQSQSNGANLNLNPALPNQSQSAAGPAVQGDAAAAVQPVLQQGDTAQSNPGDTRGESKAAAASNAVNTTSSTNTNAAATTAFTVPDQSSGEARLPINTTATTQAVDAARQAQAQTVATNTDNDSLNTARLTRGLANAVQQRGGAVTLRLTPPEMGTVRIQMQITGTNVSASFHAESSSAQTLLTTQLAQLRSALESKGMSVDRLSVQPMAATAASQNTNQSQNQSDTQQQGQSQQQSANDGRSRGQYANDRSNQQSADQQQEAGSSQQAVDGFLGRLTDASATEAA